MWLKVTELRKHRQQYGGYQKGKRVGEGRRW